MYITGHGEQVAAIVPAAVAAELERLSPGELAGLLEDFADAAVAREARGRVSGRLAENPRPGTGHPACGRSSDLASQSR